MYYAQQLKNLIVKVVGNSNDWPDPNTTGGGGGGAAGGGNTTSILPPELLNDLDYYDPAFALVVKGSSLLHSRTLTTLKVSGAGPAGGFNPNGRDDGRRFAKNDDKDDAKPGKGNGDQVAKGGDKPKDPVNPPKGGDQVASKKDGEQVAAKAPEKPAKVDPAMYWEEALAGKLTKPSWAIGVAAYLGKTQKWDHAAEFLKAALRNGVMARPWMFEAIAVATELNHGDPDEVERALLSAADLRPNDAGGFLQGAKVMGLHKQWQRALGFCTQSAAQNPDLPQPYLQAMEYAREAKNVAAMTWAAENVLSRDWPIRNDEIHAQARKALDEFGQVLAKDGRAADAERLSQVANVQKQRDLVIRLIWQGDADLDLEVKEPVGTTCSFVNRQTQGGGTILTDLAAENRTETYLASRAFSGDYQLKVRRVWGRPAGGKATLEITHFKGTPQERVQRETITLDSERTLSVKLDHGRRTELAVVTPIEALKKLDREEVAQRSSTALEQLQALAMPVFAGVNGSQMQAEATSLRKPAPAAAMPEDESRQTAVAPWFGTGVFLEAQAVVSGDRRYVRLTMNPTLTHLGGRGGSPNNPLVPGIGGNR
jgi:hypothetical protein